MSLLEVLVVVVGVAVLLFFLIVICNFIFNIPSLIRSRRLAEVAKDLGLTFSQGSRKIFTITRSGSLVKKNVISGNLKGHTIEAYDFNTPVPIWMTNGIYINNIYSHKWILVLDGQEQQDRFTRNLGLRTSVNKIRSILEEIS